MSKNNLLKTIAILAIPIAMQNLLTAFVNIIDNLMVQMISADAMSAVLLVNQVIFVFQIISLAISASTVTFMSQHYGKGNKTVLPSILGYSLTLAVPFAIMFTIAAAVFPQAFMSLMGAKGEVLKISSDFLRIASLSSLPFTLSVVFAGALRGIRNVKLTFLASFAAIFANIFFNYVLMFGKFGFPQLGAKGAALGTLIARLIEFSIIIAVVLIRKYPVVNKFKDFFTSTKEYKTKFIKFLTPSVLNELFWVLGITIYYAVYARLSNSNVVLPAISVVQSLEKLVLVFLLGIAGASTIVIGNTIGSKSREETITASKKTTQMSLITGVFCGIVLFLFNFIVPIIYSNLTVETYQLIRNILIIWGVHFLVRSYNLNAILGILRAGGDAKFCFIAETLTVWGIGVPLIALLGLVFDVRIEYLQLVLLFEDIIKLIVVRKRVNSYKWIVNLTN